MKVHDTGKRVVVETSPSNGLVRVTVNADDLEPLVLTFSKTEAERVHDALGRGLKTLAEQTERKGRAV